MVKSLSVFVKLKITTMSEAKKMVTLYKNEGFVSEEQYFDYCIESFINGTTRAMQKAI